MITPPSSEVIQASSFSNTDLFI